MEQREFVRKLRDVFPKTEEELQYPMQTFDLSSLPVDSSKSQSSYIEGVFHSERTQANDPAESRADRTNRALCILYLDGDGEQRELLRKRVRVDALGYQISRSLFHFAWRAAVRALRQRSRVWLRIGLAAVSLEDAVTDPRDSLLNLSLLHHAAVRIGVDPAELFRDAAAASGESMRDIILGFLKRPPELKSITSFGFFEGSSKDGPTLENSASLL